MNENKTEIRNLVRLIKRARRQKDFYDTDYHTGIGIGSSVPVSYVNEKYCSPIR